MKIKNRLINVETIAALKRLMEKEIKGAAAFKLLRLVKELDDIIESKKLSEEAIIKKYAAKDDNGNVLLVGDNKDMIKVEDEDLENFNNEMSDLQSLEVDVKYEPITLDELGIEQITISLNDLVKLDFLFAEV